MEDNNKIWLYNKRKREMETAIHFYEYLTGREIETNKIAEIKGRRKRMNCQNYLQYCYKRYKDHVGENYPTPKFDII